MARISLRETYDNRSVIAQIAKVTDTAEDAAETVQEKAAEINDALTDVNAAVQAAEGAVTTANAASASAQQSAQTVAGYNTRLTTAEGEIDTLQSDLNSVTLRVQTAEGNIVTIQGQITALQTADGQNVKINNINQYAVGLTGNQIVDGLKTFKLPITIDRDNKTFQWMYFMTGLGKLELPSSTQNHAIEIRNSDGTERIGLHFDVDTNGVSRIYVSGNATDGVTSVGFNQRILTVSATGTVTPGW